MITDDKYRIIYAELKNAFYVSNLESSMHLANKSSNNFWLNCTKASNAKYDS